MILSRQNHRRQDIIKRKNLTTANESDDQQKEFLKTQRETQQLVRVRANVENFGQDISVVIQTSVSN
jgi:hypothetical protein